MLADDLQTTSADGLKLRSHRPAAANGEYLYFHSENDVLDQYEGSENEPNHQALCTDPGKHTEQAFCSHSPSGSDTCTCHPISSHRSLTLPVLLTLLDALRRLAQRAG